MRRPARHLLAGVAALALLAPPGAAHAGAHAPLSPAAPAASTGTVTVTARDDDVLTVGERLDVGDALVSPSGRYRLEVRPGQGAVFSERASWLGPGGLSRLMRRSTGVEVALELRQDGLWTVLDDGAVNTSGIDAPGATSARLQDDRNLVFFDDEGRVVGHSRTGKDALVERGDVLLPGEVVRGSGNVSRLVMQPDGNLVLYRGTEALWSSGTHGHPGAGAVFQGDGNLVVYSAAAAGRVALFSTGTVGAFADGTTQTRPQGTAPYPVSGARLELDATAVALVRLVDGPSRAPHGVGGPEELREVAWASSWTDSRVLPGDDLLVGDRRVSPDRRCTVVMQGDRNLVLYCDGRAVWASGVPVVLPFDSWYGVRAIMQGDGNLVVYQLGGFFQGEQAGWHSGTRAPGSTLVVQDDRNLVVYAPGGRATWSSRTGRL